MKFCSNCGQTELAHQRADKGIIKRVVSEHDGKYYPCNKFEG